MHAVWIAYIIFVLCMALWGFYKCSSTFYNFIHTLKGGKVILCEGISSAIKGDVWKSALLRGPMTGKITAYRYSASKIGALDLKSDGTGDYCGKFVWKVI
jgi:hypothetical protein